MAKESFTGLFDNMPSVDNTLARKPTKKETPSSSKRKTTGQEAGKEQKSVKEQKTTKEQKAVKEEKTVKEQKAVTEEIAEPMQEEAYSAPAAKKPAGALPFLKAQQNMEKKNQTFYIPVYLHDRLKESAEMYNMTVSAVLTEILKSVYDEK